jgi:hypothetical protein
MHENVSLWHNDRGLTGSKKASRNHGIALKPPFKLQWDPF